MSVGSSDTQDSLSKGLDEVCGSGRSKFTDKSLELGEEVFCLVAGVRTEDLTSVMRQLSKGLLERVLEVELTEHLGHEHAGEVNNPKGNVRSGVSKKTVKGELGEVELEVPRDRQGEFEPQLVKKHQRRLAGLDKKTLSLNARGLSTTDIQAEFTEM